MIISDFWLLCFIKIVSWHYKSIYQQSHFKLAIKWEYVLFTIACLFNITNMFYCILRNICHSTIKFRNKYNFFRTLTLHYVINWNFKFMMSLNFERNKITWQLWWKITFPNIQLFHNRRKSLMQNFSRIWELMRHKNWLALFRF